MLWRILDLPELETGNVERTRNEGSAGTKTRSSTSGGGETEQELDGTTCARRGGHHRRGEQPAAGIGSRRILSTDCSARAPRDSGSGTGTRCGTGGGGLEATASAVSGQQGRATGRAAGDDHRRRSIRYVGTGRLGMAPGRLEWRRVLAGRS